jgi:hypothetical protein
MALSGRADMRWLVGCLAVGLAVLLSGCATMSEGECRLADWEAEGLAAGVNGRSADSFQRLTSACNRFGIAPDFEAFERGRARGLQSFCTPNGVYASGLRGQGDPGVCTDPALTRIHRIATNYERARGELDWARRRYDGLFNDRRRARRQINDLRRDLRKDDLDAEERDNIQERIVRLLDRLDEFDFDRRQLALRLRESERQLDRAEYELRLLESEFGFRRF